MNGFIHQIRRDLSIAWASRLDIGVILLFFVIIVTMKDVSCPLSSR